MKFDYMVKHNGVWYEVGEEVPTSNTTVVKEEVKVEKPKADEKVQQKNTKNAK